MHNSEESLLRSPRKDHIDLIRFQSVVGFNLGYKCLFGRFVRYENINPLVAQERSVMTNQNLFEGPTTRSFPTLCEVEPCKLGRMVERVAIGSIDDEPPQVRRVRLWPDLNCF